MDAVTVADHPETERATAVELLARLEALTARLDDQATRVASLEAENARLRSTPTVPPTIAAGEARIGRRGMLRTVLGATAAAGVLAVAKATPAHAHDTDDIFRNHTTATDFGANLNNSSATALLPYVFWGNNYSLFQPALPDARIGLVGTVSSVDNASKNRYGVYGAVDGNAPNAGVVGSGVGATGVLGSSTSDIGVQGVSTSSIGVYGISANYMGCGGITQKASYAGLFGYGGVAGSYGFYGAAAAGGSAALFVGNVTITGNLTVVGSYPKSAAVKKRDGTLARMYCQEAPEPWFEDFGTATLANGHAVVDLEPEFDQVVKGEDYHVFLTEYGDLGGLYVADVKPHRFEVRSRSGAAGTFGYRVVARRLDDVGTRMEKVESAKIPVIDVEALTRRAQDAPPAPRVVPGSAGKPKP